MRKLLVMLAFASVVVSSNASAQEAGTAIPPMPPVPIGHVQPTTRGFESDFAANKIEQQRLSAFDAEQRKLDEMLDKKLNICRC
jgi:hypothetical protein